MKILIYFGRFRFIDEWEPSTHSYLSLAFASDQMFYNEDEVADFGTFTIRYETGLLTL